MKAINPYRLFVGSFIPNWLMRMKISAGAKLCYARLCQYAGEKGWASAKQETLAAELSVSDRQVRDYMTELVKHNLIAIRRPGLNKANIIIFLEHEEMSGRRTDAPGGSGPERKDSSGPERKHSSSPLEENTTKKEEKKERPPNPLWERARCVLGIVQSWLNPNAVTQENDTIAQLTPEKLWPESLLSAPFGYLAEELASMYLAAHRKWDGKVSWEAVHRHRDDLDVKRQPKRGPDQESVQDVYARLTDHGDVAILNRGAILALPEPEGDYEI